MEKSIIATGKTLESAIDAALRQLVGCGRGITGVTPARVVARSVGGFTLACPDAAPAPDADGLTAQVPLTDTADLWGTVYFVKK